MSIVLSVVAAVAAAVGLFRWLRPDAAADLAELAQYRRKREEVSRNEHFGEQPHAGG